MAKKKKKKKKKTSSATAGRRRRATETRSDTTGGQGPLVGRASDPRSTRPPCAGTGSVGQRHGQTSCADPTVYLVGIVQSHRMDYLQLSEDLRTAIRDALRAMNIVTHRYRRNIAVPGRVPRGATPALRRQSRAKGLLRAALRELDRGIERPRSMACNVSSPKTKHCREG